MCATEVRLTQQVHLTQDNGNAEKTFAAPQYSKAMIGALAISARSSDAVLLGDFNFGDGENPESMHLKTEYVDVWHVTNPDEKGFTWNIEKSSMAKKGSFPGEVSRRLDRILVKSKRLNPQKTEIIGNQPVNKNSSVFASDHFGLLSQLVVKQAHDNSAQQTPKSTPVE
jgi:endonuclease/exonuclease/phosphatase family metal-dependent hydrolase